MLQATAANGPLEDRGGNWAGSVTLGFSQAQGGGAAGRQDGGLCTEGAQAPPRPSSAFIFSLRNLFQRMMSVENDSTMHARYSSIPADPSLTVLKLSIKQHKGEKNSKSSSSQAL